MKDYVDVYLNGKGLSPRQLQDREDVTIQKITSNVNKSIEAAVGKVIVEMKIQQQDAQKRQIKKQYDEGEIRGGVYLVGVIAEHFMSPQGARIVNTIANSAVQVNMMITALSAGALGPVGMSAGCVSIALNLLGLFGSKGPSANQMIIEAVGKVQDSIFSLHKEMRELFGTVIENQRKMMDRIESQFELLKTKQDQALQQLEEIRYDLKLLIDENRVRSRAMQTADLDKKIQSLNTQINKKINGDNNIERGKIEELIEECHLYAIKTTKYDDFTGLPNPDEAMLQWDPKKIITIFKSGDLIDHFVGIIPLILNRFAPEITASVTNNKVINNPRGLARATMALSVAYVMFPEVAKTYEGRKLQYIADIKLLIFNTKNLLLISTNEKVIQKLKGAYIDLLKKIIEDSLNNAENAVLANNHLSDKSEINILALSPNTTFSSEYKDYAPTVTSYFPDNTILEKDIFNRDFGPGVDGGPRPLVGRYRSISWNRADASPINTEEFLNYLAEFNIIKIEPGEPYEHYLSMGTLVVILEPGAPYGPLSISQSFKEISVPSKIIVNHLSSEATVLGDGIRSGWINSKLIEQDSQEKNIAYISNDLLSNELVGGSSWIFLNKMMDEVNLLIKCRKELIENTNTLINDDANKLTLEFEATSICLKYLAGINIYLKTGDLELGTAVAKDKVAGINTYVTQNGDGNVVRNNDTSFPLSNRSDITQLILNITDIDFMKKSDYFKSAEARRVKLKDYVKTVIIDSAGKIFDEYVLAYFSQDSISYNLPELTMSEIMLSSAEKSIRNKQLIYGNTIEL